MKYLFFILCLLIFGCDSPTESSKIVIIKMVLHLEVIIIAMLKIIQECVLLIQMNTINI